MIHFTASLSSKWLFPSRNTMARQCNQPTDHSPPESHSEKESQLRCRMAVKKLISALGLLAMRESVIILVSLYVMLC